MKYKGTIGVIAGAMGIGIVAGNLAVQSSKQQDTFDLYVEALRGAETTSVELQEGQANRRILDQLNINKNSLEGRAVMLDLMCREANQHLLTVPSDGFMPPQCDGTDQSDFAQYALKPGSYEIGDPTVLRGEQ